jgi:hypothetical protein
METNKRILLYGNSLILESIGASLRRLSQFEVKTLNPPLQQREKLDAANTDIILFDMGNTRPEALLSLQDTNTALELIGVSPGINLVKVWSIRELQEMSMGDLLEVITCESKGSSVKSGGKEVRSNRRLFNK